MSKKNILDILKIKNITIIGSSSDKNIIYPSDIDTQERVKWTGSKKELLEVFQDKFKRAYNDPNVFITDFKAGITENNIPLRWNYKSIMDGYQIYNNKKYNFIGQLEKHSIIKLDIIAVIDEKFVEFSCNYYFRFGKNKTDPNFLDSLDKSYLLDAIKFNQQDKIYKSLKRMYSLFKLDPEKYSDQIKQLQDLFNSKLGRLYSIMNQLNIIATVANVRPNNKYIKHNLEIVLKEVPKDIDVQSLKGMIDKPIDVDLLIDYIEKLNDKLNVKLNSKLKSYAKKHNIILEPKGMVSVK